MKKPWLVSGTEKKIQPKNGVVKIGQTRKNGVLCPENKNPN